MFLISVIIAIHNAEKTLHLTLQSLRSAIGNAKNEIEIIAINDNSFDNTQYIIEFWKKKFLHFISQKVIYCNIGQVRNYAISLSSGKYIMMLDSDDQLKKNSLSDAVFFLKKNHPDMLLTHLLEIRNNSKITDIWNGFTPKILKKEETIERFLIHKDFQAHLIGQFIHRKLYINNPIPSFICYEDFAIFPNLLMQAKKIFYQKKGCYFYIKRNNSLSNTFTAEKISILVECTLNMEKIFPKKYKHLINYHWLIIYNKHLKYLNNEQYHIVKNRINNLYSLSFFFSRKMFFFIRRFFKLKWRE